MYAAASVCSCCCTVSLLCLQILATIETLSVAKVGDAAKQQADLQSAMDALSSQKPPSVELYGKLARAAAQAGLWGSALQCAATAVAAVLPPGISVQDADTKEVAPGVSPADWYWAGVAESVQAQASL